MRIRRRLFLVLAFLIIASQASSLVSCSPHRSRVQLKVIIAGSLLVPFQALEKEFEKVNPDIDILLEGHGSVQVIRSVTELNYNADLIAVADAQLIPLMMYSLPVPESGKPYANWCIKFSANRLGIAYKAESRSASQINADNWFKIMIRPDVSIGLADPRIDALGYRTVMAVQLAEGYYKDETLLDKIIGCALKTPLGITKDKDTATIKVPELVKSTQQRIKLRSYSIQLMALLESGDIDYSFEYESVAKQRGLEFLRLPDAINLGNQEFEKDYRHVKVQLDFQRFASVMPVFEGTQIIYGATIPANALHSKEAVRFLEYLLGAEGQRIFEMSHQPLLTNMECDNAPGLPGNLQSYFRREK